MVKSTAIKPLQEKKKKKEGNLHIDTYHLEIYKEPLVCFDSTYNHICCSEYWSPTLVGVRRVLNHAC